MILQLTVQLYSFVNTEITISLTIFTHNKIHAYLSLIMQFYVIVSGQIHVTMLINNTHMID